MPPRPTPMETLPTTADEVRLSDGRRARVRDADPAADRRIDVLMLQCRFLRGGQLNPLVGTRARVVLSIVEIDGEAVPWPPCQPTHAALTAYFNKFTAEDLEALAVAYSAANSGATTQLLSTGLRRHRVMA